MIHTLELSKMISKQTFENIISSLNIKPYRRCWITRAYADKGLTVIRLYKFLREDVQSQPNKDSDLTHYYMICISINTGLIFGKNAHTSNNLLTFTPDFVKAIYYHIFDLIPCMEQAKKYRDSNFGFWFEVNAFKAHRIDFCFDLKTMYQEYIKLINMGYSLRETVYKRNYYDDTEIAKTQIDEEPNIPDIETIAPELKSDINYIYFTSKGVNVNIYLKDVEIARRQLEVNPESDYDFLRIEVQAKKTKLNAIVSKFGLKGRELQYILTPEVENYILKSYVKALTGTGAYVTLDKARTIISQSKYMRPKKNKLIKLIETVSTKHGIAKVLEQVENGTITEFGSLKKVKSYLKEIQTELNINPVTISTTMKIPELLTEVATGKRPRNMLPNLVDLIDGYYEQLKEDQQYGQTYTQEDFEQIDKL